MTTEEKIREAYERITTESGFKQSVGGFIYFKAGYLAAQKEAFEQAAKVAAEATTDMRFQSVRDYNFAARISEAIRQLIKE